MPAASDFGDGVTVIEGPSASIGFAHAHVASGSSRSKGVEWSSMTKSHTTFAKTSDYFSEERPFVVLIGKKGVIGALQDLDQILRTVRVITLSQPSTAVLPNYGDLLTSQCCAGCRRGITRSFLTRWVVVTVARGATAVTWLLRAHSKGTNIAFIFLSLCVL